MSHRGTDDTAKDLDRDFPDHSTDHLSRCATYMQTAVCIPTWQRIQQGTEGRAHGESETPLSHLLTYVHGVHRDYESGMDEQAEVTDRLTRQGFT